MSKGRIINKLKINSDKSKGQMDFLLFLVIIILLCFGLVMLASASTYYSLSSYGTSSYFLKRQLVFAVIGIAAMIIISNIDYRWYKKLSYIGFAIALLFMIAVLIPGIGQERNGATRWLGVGTFTFQPSEFMKIAIVMATATYLSLNYKKTGNIKGYVIPLAMLFIVIIIMYLQNHLSGTIIMIVATFSIIFASGIKIKFKDVLILIMLFAVAGAAYFKIKVKSSDSSDNSSFRVQRIISFLNPEDDKKGGNWQAIQSLYALGSGGIFGRGLGQSREKYSWLPEGQNDFIFSVLGEELGLVGTIIVLALFIFFIYRGYLVALRCPDMYGSLIATGIMSVFSLQILVNIAVVTCSMPVTGMPLPFFSYGGTALCINLCAMGIVLNISKNCK